MTNERNAQLLGPWMCFSMVVGSMIGAGIFMLPVSLAPLGPNAIVGWIVSAAGALCLAYSLARLTKTGGEGIYFYIERAFGPAVAFLVGWSFWISIWTAAAALAITTAASLSRAAPQIFPSSTIPLIAIVCIGLLTLINALGVRAAGRVQVLTVLIKVLPLIAVIAILAGRVGSGAEVESLGSVPITLGNVATAATLTLFALTGFENMTTPVNKVRDPTRTLPRAILGGTAFVALLYLLSSTSASLLVPTGEVARSTAPYADAIATEWGSFAAVFTALCIAVSAFGCLNAGVLAGGELGLAMSLGGDLPKWLSRTTSAGTPVLSQILVGSLGVSLVLINSSRGLAGLFTFIILLATASTLILYFVGALAAMKMRQPLGGRLVIGVGLLFALFAFWGAGIEALAWNLVLIAIGFAVRFLIRLSSRAATPPAAAPAALPGSSA